MPYTPPNSCIKYRSLDVCIIEYRSLKVFPNLGCCLPLWSTWHWGWWWWWWWWWQGGGGVENVGCIKYRLPDCWRLEADPRDISIESPDEENQKHNSISSEIELLLSSVTNFVSFFLLCNQEFTLEMESKFSLHTFSLYPAIMSMVIGQQWIHFTKFPSSSQSPWL